MHTPQVVILGGGPAGVGAAYWLRRRQRADVTLLEQQPVVGGNAGSFELNGLRVDYGSHRLHYTCAPHILADLASLLGGDLLSRPRNGRIRLRGRWLRFPLKPADLLLRLDPAFGAGAALDMARRLLPGGPPEGETFASVLRANLGPTICEHFYFPYARKIWGREPEALSGIQARRRVSAGTFSKLLKRLVRTPGAGRFYYPRRGFGQISEALGEAAAELGADIRTRARVVSLARPEGGGRWAVTIEEGSERHQLEADQVWSTLPIPLAARLMAPAVAPEVLEAAGRIQYRAMALVYLTLDVPRFTPTDAHYFPETSVLFTRVSEPRNYSAVETPPDRTVLCAEVPCDADDAVWRMEDGALGGRVVDDLGRAGLALARPPVDVHVRRLRQAYPQYLMGYERPFSTLDHWAGSMPGFLTFGRQGLFAHDNTHHALYMAWAAVDCLGDGGFDASRWEAYRTEFARHVVED